MWRSPLKELHLRVCEAFVQSGCHGVQGHCDRSDVQALRFAHDGVREHPLTQASEVSRQGSSSRAVHVVSDDDDAGLESPEAVEIVAGCDDQRKDGRTAHAWLSSAAFDREIAQKDLRTVHAVHVGDTVWWRLNWRPEGHGTHHMVVTASLVLVVHEMVGLGVVVLVAVTEECRVARHLAGGVMRAQTSIVELRATSRNGHACAVWTTVRV